MNFSWNIVLAYLIPFIKMLLILVIGHFIVVGIMRFCKSAFDRANLDQSLVAFLNKAINILLHILVAISALNSIGVSTTGVLAALSAAAVGVAVALKDSLSNVAGGILLLIAPRFVTGDYISAGGDEGVVVNVDLLHTTVRTVDNRQVSIPNGVLINNHITNYSHESERRVDITFSISYDSDVEAAKRIILNIISSHPLVKNKPEPPVARVIGYDESAVKIITRSWVNTPDYWSVHFDILEQVRPALEAEGIRIPYNQLDVHIKTDKE